MVIPELFNYFAHSPEYGLARRVGINWLFSPVKFGNPVADLSIDLVGVACLDITSTAWLILLYFVTITVVPWLTLRLMLMLAVRGKRCLMSVIGIIGAIIIGFGVWAGGYVYDTYRSWDYIKLPNLLAVLFFLAGGAWLIYREIWHDGKLFGKNVNL